MPQPRRYKPANALKKRVIQTSVTEEFYRAVKERANLEKLSVPELVRKALQSHLVNGGIR